MKALITGVTGFAGGYLAEHLLRTGDRVLGATRDLDWPPGAPPSLTDAVPLVKWDITQPIDPAARIQLIQFEPDIVFHLAGMSVPSDCGETEPTEQALAANVHGVERVIELMGNWPAARLAFVSSCMVYSPVTEESPVVKEKAETAPNRAYGQTKLMAEDLIQKAAYDRGMDYVIMRAFNHAGPRQAPRMMLSEWAHQLANLGGEPLRVISRDSHLDLTDVRDTVRAYRDLAASAKSGVYNVGSGKSICSGDVLELLLHRYHASVAVEELKPGRRQLPIADNSRMRRAINWRAEIPLEQTVADTLQYWMEQSK